MGKTKSIAELLSISLSSGLKSSVGHQGADAMGSTEGVELSELTGPKIA